MEADAEQTSIGAWKKLISSRSSIMVDLAASLMPTNFMLLLYFQFKLQWTTQEYDSGYFQFPFPSGDRKAE